MPRASPWHRVALISCPCDSQSRTQSNACARARMALAYDWLWRNWQPEPLNLGFRFFVRVPVLFKPITAQEKFNFPRANAILARAQALLWVRDCAIRGSTLKSVRLYQPRTNWLKGPYSHFLVEKPPLAGDSTEIRLAVPYMQYPWVWVLPHTGRRTHAVVRMSSNDNNKKM